MEDTVPQMSSQIKMVRLGLSSVAKHAEVRPVTKYCTYVKVHLLRIVPLK